MIEKVIEIEFPNGAIYKVKASVVALNRAEYYAKERGIEKGSKQWDELFELSITEDKVYHWISKIMDWSEVEPHAKFIRMKNDFDYNKLWADAAYTIMKNNSDQRW